uniref:Uncharacterized protein LOC114334715 n=1 Tax=Diabrotica virgifera virgifera TaxID=50390 RepID=A0A6P7FW30_DIAVI
MENRVVLVLSIIVSCCSKASLANPAFNSRDPTLRPPGSNEYPELPVKPPSPLVYPPETPLNQQNPFDNSRDPNFRPPGADEPDVKISEVDEIILPDVLPSRYVKDLSHPVRLVGPFEPDEQFLFAELPGL